VETELIALTSTGAAALVGLLITDSWQEARSSMGSLWRRAEPDRADAVESELGEARCALLAARSAGNDQVALGLIIDWHYRIDRLLAAFPQTAVQLRRVVEDELAPALAAVGS